MKRLIILLILCLTASTSGWTGIKPMLGRQIDRSHPLSKGLIGLWLMNEGSGDIIQDLSGNGNTGAFVSTPVWTGSKYGSALAFDGAADTVACGNNRIGGLTSGTVLAWVYFTPGDSSEQHIFDISNVQFYYNNANTLHILPGGNVAAGDISGSWHQIAYTFAPANVNMYLDSKAIFFDFTSHTFQASPNVYIGNFYGGGNFAINGKVDHALIYKRALSASEITLLYREPFCYMADDLPVTMKYTYAAAPPPTGSQMILISGIPIILIGCAVYTYKRAA